jgi:hypothetical protein
MSTDSSSRRTSQQELQRKAEGAEPSIAFRRQQDAYSEQVGKYVVSRLQQLHVVAFLVMMLFSCRAAWLMNDGPSRMTCIMSIFLTSYRVYLHFAGHSESARHTFALVWHLVMMLAVLLRLKSVLTLPLDELILSIDRINDVDHSMRQLTHAIVGFVLATSWYGVGSFARMMLAVWTLIAMATGAVVGVRLGDAANLTNTLMDVCLPAVSGYFLGQFIRDELIFALVTRAADKDAIVAELAVLAEESVARGMKLEQARAARKADSRLNHIIKGKCGIAHMSMELAVRTGPELPPEQIKIFENVKMLLRQATEWTHLRQLFLDLEDGAYRPNLVPCCLVDFLHASHTVVDCSVPATLWMRFDLNIARLVLDEAISNAHKYREPDSPIVLRATIAEEEMDSAASVAGKNGGDEDLGASSPVRRLRACKLALEVENVNRAGMKKLNESECLAAFSQGHRSHSVDVTSDGIGLDNVRIAADAAGGRAWLEVHTDEHQRDCTSLHLMLPAEIDETATAATAATAMATTSSVAPSVVASSVDVAGQVPSPVTEGATRGSKTSPPADTTLATGEGGVTGGGPICIGVDDDRFSSAFLLMLFERLLGADMSRSAVLHEKSDVLTRVEDVALGRCTLTMDGSGKVIGFNPVDLAEQRHADLMVLDQNISFGDGEGLVGTDIAERLRQLGFKGVICIVTGSSLEVIRDLQSIQAVDLVYAKGENLRTVSDGIHKVLEERRQL